MRISRVQVRSVFRCCNSLPARRVREGELRRQTWRTFVDLMRVSKKSDVDCGGSTKEIDEVVALEKIVAVKDKVKAAVHKFNQSEAVKKKKKKPLDPASMDDFVKANDSVLNRLMQAMAKDGIASTRHLSAVRIHLTTLEDTPKTGTINDTRNLDIV